MLNHIIRKIVVRAMIVALALTVCATSTRADIVVGLSMALTGSNAAVGVSAQRGFEQAVADINRASGGVLGHKVIADVGFTDLKIAFLRLLILKQVKYYLRQLLIADSKLANIRRYDRHKQGTPQPKIAGETLQKASFSHQKAPKKSSKQNNYSQFVTKNETRRGIKNCTLAGPSPSPNSLKYLTHTYKEEDAG